jgi:DNA-directed RNA polymerase subunit N (RpoN/RPB10)
VIIPVRCFTCNKVIADKWNYYVRRCKEEEKAAEGKVAEGNDDKRSKKQLDPLHFDENVRQKVFEELGLDRICCRRMLLGHIDLIDKI